MFRAYLELIRPPNVATAFADVLAGFAIAGRGNPTALPWLLGASACLYAGGVVLNDLFDRHLDAVERPERPLPSGRVPVSRAAQLGGGFVACGVLAAFAAGPVAGVVAGVLAVSILLYDALLKRQAVLGPLAMGGCRGLNLVLGMAAVPASLSASWPLALVTVAYITGVTVVSRGEVSGGQRVASGLALVLVSGALAALAGLSIGPDRLSMAGLVLTAALAARVLPAFWAAYRRPDPATVRRAVKRGVLSLVLVDAVFGVVYASLAYGGLILATGLLAGYLSRFFFVT